MANTKVVNPSKKTRTAAQKRADSKMRGKSRPKRRANPKRRTTRRYGGASRAPARRRRTATASRRRAPATRRRARNPARRGLMDLDYLMDTIPAATGGVMAARWAIKIAGPLETDAAGVKKPGIKHAFFGYIAAVYGGQLIGSLFGNDRAGDVAEIAALGYLGDLFAREYVFDNPDGWYRQNLYLGNVGRSPYSGVYQAPGLGANAGQTFTDASGQQYVRGPKGWMLAGSQPRAGEGQNLPGMGPMGGFAMKSGLGGFAMNSALGHGLPSGFVPQGYMQKSGGYDSGQTIGHTYKYGGLYGRP